MRTLRQGGHAQESFRVRERLRELELGTVVVQRIYNPLPTQPAGPLYRAGQNMAWGSGWGLDSQGAQPISAQSDFYGIVNLVGTAQRVPNTLANHPAPGGSVVCWLPGGYAPPSGRELQALITDVDSPMYARLDIRNDGAVIANIYNTSSTVGWARISVMGRYSIV